MKGVFFGFPSDPEYHNGDDETYNRVSKREPDIHPDCTHKNCQARKAISPCMIAIGNKARAADLFSHPNADLCHGFIPDTTDKCRCCYSPDKSYLLWVKETFDGNISGYNRRDQDHQNYKNTCKILNPAVSIGKTFCRLPPGEHERKKKRDSGECIAKIVNGISEQGDTSRIINNGELEKCYDEQAGKRPFDCPDTPLIRKKWMDLQCRAEGHGRDDEHDFCDAQKNRPDIFFRIMRRERGIIVIVILRMSVIIRTRNHSVLPRHGGDPVPGAVL